MSVVHGDIPLFLYICMLSCICICYRLCSLYSFEHLLYSYRYLLQQTILLYYSITKMTLYSIILLFEVQLDNLFQYIFCTEKEE